ncbi:branched-chain amino acid ABC transporter permease [Microbacterium sediminis]|uniref:Branched-chain amino acid ABC transporter permease n=1 Tax=Microbacterium sediminis TaxID=904291 RepID=A0A1B9NDD1_9MICO|nr:branched-chain amino acid ABC transporter permease [Microbacterium sediminis]OCG74583.1 branched-chain amino acid ABC transporter permease [Microbacterium sediminis]
MNHTIAPSRRSRAGAVMALAGVLIALLAWLFAPTPAHAADGDPYTVSGNVQLDGEPLEGVALTIDGPGGEQEVETDADGRWSVKVPERDAEYTVTLDESTLPEGIAVIEDADGDGETNVTTSEMGQGGRLTVNFFIGEGERNVTSFFDQFVQRLFLGLNFGLMLGLAAVGLSLVFGTTGISNFAHAEMVTFGAVAALLLVGPASLALPVWAGIPLAVILSAVLGFVLDAIIWRPLRRRGVGVVQLMILSIGLSLALRYLFNYFIGGDTQQLPPMVPNIAIPLFGAVTTSLNDLVSMAISIVVIVAFALWLTRSRLGKATRAISDNPSLAAASGIDVDHVVRIVWIISGALAGLAGILYAYYRPGIRWDMGAQVLLLVFAAVTLGGLGTAYGALIGSIVIGLLTELSSLWIPSDLRYAGALVVLIIILLVRPQGILGRRERIG